MTLHEQEGETEVSMWNNQAFKSSLPKVGYVDETLWRQFWQSQEVQAVLKHSEQVIHKLWQQYMFETPSQALNKDVNSSEKIADLEQDNRSLIHASELATTACLIHSQATHHPDEVNVDRSDTKVCHFDTASLESTVMQIVVNDADMKTEFERDAAGLQQNAPTSEPILGSEIQDWDLQSRNQIIDLQCATLTESAPLPLQDVLESHVTMPIFPVKSLNTPVASQTYQVNFPNARQGEAYATHVTLVPHIDAIITQLEFEPECGLVWNPQSLQCEGIPILNGDVNVKIWWHVNAQDAPQHELTVAKLYINADPKLLWRNIPSDPKTLFWKSDEACQAIDGQRVLIGARVRGRSHAHVGTCCDDDFSMLYLDGNYPAYITMVADGAGSASFSRLGSKVAVDAAMLKLQELIVSEKSQTTLEKMSLQGASQSAAESYMESVLSHAVYAAYQAQEDVATAQNDHIENIKQLSTTLLIGLAIAVNQNQWLVGAYWVGDGVLVLYQPNTNVDVLGQADSGQFSGETRFLSQGDWSENNLKKRVTVRILDELPVLIAMTDGVTDAKFENEQAMSDVRTWDVLWQEWQNAWAGNDNVDAAAQTLQKWLGFWSPGNHDDRTVVLCVPKSWMRPNTHEETA